MGYPTAIYQTYAADAMGTPSDGVSVSGTSTYYSRPWSGHRSAWFGIQLVWSGTPTGTLTIWSTDVPEPSLADDTDWVQDTTWAPTNPAGTANKMADNGQDSVHRFFRIKYVNSAGSGVLKGYVTQSKIGAI